MITPCILCKKQIPTLLDDTDYLDSAVRFHGEPGYGSEFDSVGGDGFIELIICDDCLRQLGEAGEVCETSYPPWPVPQRKTWDPHTWM